MGDSNDTNDFLSRERALLGDDADQFASDNDKLATVEDGDDDLLGGEYSQANVGSQEMDGFENSFPAIDTTNDVSNASSFTQAATPSSQQRCKAVAYVAEGL